MKRQSLFIVTVALTIASSSLAQTNATKPTTQPPPYSVVRWTEDYSYLKNQPGNDFFDPIKYIALGEDLSLSLGGQLRSRYEYFSNNNFGAGPQDDNGYFLTRGLFHADFKAFDVFRVFAQVKTAMIDGREGGPRPIDADEIDLEQLFFDIRIPLPTAEKDSMTFRAGRQDLIYGAQRLISPLDWANVRRTFEGVKLSTVTGNNTLDLFLVRPVIVDKEELNDGDGNQTFYGVYDTLNLPQLGGKDAKTKAEFYFLGLSQTQAPNRPIDVDTYTLGARISSNPKPFDFDVEVMYQFGDSGTNDINAYALAIEGGYTFDTTWSPRVYLGFDYASGDDNPNDGEKGTFNQLFPLGHAYFGYIDVIGRQNIMSIHPGVQLTFVKDRPYAKSVKLRADYHWFWRAETSDALYNAGGGVIRAAGGSDQDYVGSELDLLLDWQVNRHLSFYVGYSHFFAGDFLEDTGASDDIDFFYVAGQFTF